MKLSDLSPGWHKSAIRRWTECQEPLRLASSCAEVHYWCGPPVGLMVFIGDERRGDGTIRDLEILEEEKRPLSVQADFAVCWSGLMC